MEISLKTGIEHRFSLNEVKSPVKFHVLFGKTKEFYGNFPWNSYMVTIRFPRTRLARNGSKFKYLFITSEKAHVLKLVNITKIDAFTRQISPDHGR